MNQKQKLYTKMMKMNIKSLLRNLKILLSLPLIILVFSALAEPGNSYSENVNVAAKKGKVYGKVSTVDMNSLQGATVVVKGTTDGTVTDVFGNFLLKSVPADAELVFSYVGFNTVKIKPEFDHMLNVKMDIATIGVQKIVVTPEEETTTLSVLSDEFGITVKGIIDNKPPLYVMDGKLIDKSEFKSLNPDIINQISVLKDSSEIRKYGEKGENGIIVMTSKKITPVILVKKIDDIQVAGGDGKKEQKPVFKVVEQLPQFPGGEKRMMYYLSVYTKYPKQAITEKVEGTVEVNFMVGKNGKVEKVKVLKGAHPAFDAEAIRVVGSMPYWTPGMQNDIPAEVYYTIPIEFSLHTPDK
jgi:TonB family protein